MSPNTPTGRPRGSVEASPPRPAGASDTEPRRLTPTERLHEVTMAFAQRTAAPPEHSVEITRNAKGVVQFEVTVRGTDIDAVLAQARAAFDELDLALPYPEES